MLDRAPDTEVPSTHATAGAPGYEATQWYDVLLAARVPQPISALLYQEISAILQVAVVRALDGGGWRRRRAVRCDSLPLMSTETVTWTKVVKAAVGRAA